MQHSSKLRRFVPQLESLDSRINPSIAIPITQISFGAAETFSDGNGAVATAFADLTGTGKQDVVTLNSNGTLSILMNTTPAGSTTATFAPAVQVSLGTGITARALAIGDLNLDGRPDIVVVGEQGQNGIVMGLMNTLASGSSTPTFVESGSLKAGWTPSAVTLADFDGDGRLDIATADGTSNTVTVMKNSTVMGSTQLTLSPMVSFAAGTDANSIAEGDINGDGRTDIVVSNGNAGTATILLNQTLPTNNTLAFTSATVSLGITNPTSIALAGLNGSGLLNIVAAGGDTNNTGGVSVLYNQTVPGSLSFTSAQIYSTSTPVSSLVLSDFNQSGQNEITIFTPSNNSVSVLDVNYINSAARFTVDATATVPAGTRGISTSDIFGNGATALIATTSTANTISLFANTSVSEIKPAVGLLDTSSSNPGVSGTQLPAGTGSPTWTSISNETPTLQAANASSVWAVSFAKSGIQGLYGNFWLPISTTPATALAVDSAGNVWASFAGAGVAVYHESNKTWYGLPGTTATATQLAVNANGDVFASFVGYGVYRYRSTTGWEQINGHEATSLSIDANGSVVANFTGFGIGQYIAYAQGWRLLSPSTASALTVSSNGSIYASFSTTGGINEWSSTTGTWTALTAAAPANSLAVDQFGNAYYSTTDFGIWSYAPTPSNPYGWQQLRTNGANNLVLFAQYGYAYLSGMNEIQPQ